MTPAIEAREVWKVFEPGAVEAVRGASLAAYPGELIAVMGPSGSGKTTLLSLLGAMLSSTRGELFIGGRPLSRLSEPERVLLRRRHLGFVFQSFNLFPALSARENVELTLRLCGAEDPKGRALRALDSVGLSARADFLPRDLSGGQKQRVAIARALVHEPKVVLADEPTGALDSANGLAVVRLLTELAARSGAAVVVVTHDPRLRAFATRTFHMDDGRLSLASEPVPEEGVFSRG